MATSFFTSREEAQAWFTLETRALPMPDGTTKPHTDCRLTWRSYDFIIKRGLFTAAQLVNLTSMTARERGEAFESNFPSVLAYIHDEYLKSLDRRRHRVDFPESTFFLT